MLLLLLVVGEAFLLYLLFCDLLLQDVYHWTDTSLVTMTRRLFAFV